LNCRLEIKYRFCSACTRCTNLQQQNRPQVFDKLEEKSSKEVLYGLVKYKDEEFRVGSAVFLQPKTFKFKYPLPYQNNLKNGKREVDEDKFPEYYRKFNDRIKGSNIDTPEPFDIGYITSIFATTNVKLLASTSLYIKIKKLYRPENTYKSESLKQRSDINMLYWSEEGKNIYIYI
jgi:DNA (cytosine-5)-methyltransferase 1